MDYHSDFSSWSKSMLCVLRRSKTEAYHTYITRKMPAKVIGEPAIKGIVKHCIALEGASVSDLVEPYPADVLNKNGGLIGPRVKALKAEWPDVTFVKESEYDELCELTNNVLQTEAMQAFIGVNAIVEERFDALIEDVPCKCKPDIVREYDTHLDVFDLKFPKVFSREAFERSNKNFAYWLQRSHYVAILERVFQKPVRNFTFLMIESSFPRRVLPKHFDPVSTIPEANKEHVKTLRMLRELLDRDAEVQDDPVKRAEVWRDDWPSLVVMNQWDFNSIENDDELVEVE